MTTRTRKGRTQRTAEQQSEHDQKILDDFNGRFPVGRAVWYWTALPFGPVKETVIRESAWWLQSGEPVCMVNGVSGGVSIWHITEIARSSRAVRRLRWRWAGMLQERGGDKKEHRVHPTQKPVAVMRWAISQAPEDVETILDPFAGSGTTGIAARREGKRCILIERELKYCEAIVTRLRGEPVRMMF